MQIFTSKYTLVNNEIKKSAYLYVEDGKFKTISFTKPVEPVIDFGNCLIAPGTINTHLHSMQSLIRGLGDDKSLFTWLREIVYKYCDLMDERHAYWGALLSFAEMIRNGITTAVDFFYLNGPDNIYARAVIKAAQDIGMRLVLARTMMDWDKGARIVYEDSRTARTRFIELYEDYKNNRFIKVCPAPHSVYGSSEKMILEAVELSNMYNIPCHMHVSDSKTACETVLKDTGREYVKYLRDIKALDKNFVAVHCTWCSNEELDILAEHGVRVSHNPTSNKFLGDPIAKVVDMLNRKIQVGLGTDGAASNNCLSVFQEMKMCALDQKSLYHNPQIIDAETIWNMGTAKGASITGFPTGEIKAGLEADFIIMDLDELSLVPEKNIKSHLVYAMAEQAIIHVYIAGKPVIKSGKFINIDTKQLVREVNNLADKWQ